MSVTVVEEPCIRHTLPGRVRVYVPGWAGKGKRTIETGLRQIEGVRRVQANPLTSTVLIEYDATLTDVQTILHEVRALDLEKINALDPARADLLAPDLRALSAIIEAGVRRDAAVHDAVGLSTLSNVIGLIWGWRGMPGIEVAVHAVYLTALGALADAWLRLLGGKRAGSGSDERA